MYFLIALFLNSFIAQAQQKSSNDAAVIASLKKNINYLADDKLEGRRTGTAGEKLAYEFIQTEFKKAGLQTFTADKKYVQEFEVNEGREIDKSITFIIGDIAYTENEHYFPFAFSGNLAETKLETIRKDVAFFDLADLLKENQNNPHFERLTYTEAIEILRESNHNKKKKFQYLIEGWGTDLQSEHERYLVEKHFKKPVILTDYPKEIKSFYMRQNDDGKTVAAMDILAPGIGEIVGGSQREERLDKLLQRMEEMHIPVEEMNFYLDTRRFGSCPHAGFGLGFERLVLFVTGMTNIRDVIPFPRYPKSAAF